MADEDFETEKLYYTMGEVTKMFDVNPSLIRFWEKEFDMIQPKKNKKGNRLFTSSDLEIFRTIYDLVKQKGYTLQGAKASLKKAKSNSTPDENEVLINRLKGIQKELLELRNSL